jgi:hypothetical protein
MTITNTKAIAKVSSVTGSASDLEATALRKGSPMPTSTRDRTTEMKVIKKDSDMN